MEVPDSALVCGDVRDSLSPSATDSNHQAQSLEVNRTTPKHLPLGQASAIQEYIYIIYKYTVLIDVLPGSGHFCCNSLKVFSKLFCKSLLLSRVLAISLMLLSTSSSDDNFLMTYFSFVTSGCRSFMMESAFTSTFKLSCKRMRLVSPSCRKENLTYFIIV